MQTFVRLLEQSVLTRGIIAIMMIGITGIQVVNNQPIPGEWWAIVGASVTFFFSGAQTQAQAHSVASAVKYIVDKQS